MFKQTSEQMQQQVERQLVIYDGVCRFCHAAVLFIIKRDPHRRFIFAPLQSDVARQQIEKYCPEQIGIDTFVLIKKGRAFLWSDAALEICRDLSGLWRWLAVLRLVPRSFRDWFYQQLAKRRYKLFGRLEACALPKAEERDRYIGVDP